MVFVVAALQVAAVLSLSAYVALGPGTVARRLAWACVPPGLAGTAAVGIDALSEPRCGALLDLVGQRATGGWVTLHCLTLALLVATLVAAVTVPIALARVWTHRHPSTAHGEP